MNSVENLAKCKDRACEQDRSASADALAILTMFGCRIAALWATVLDFRLSGARRFPLADSVWLPTARGAVLLCVPALRVSASLNQHGSSFTGLPLRRKNAGRGDKRQMAEQNRPFPCPV